MPRLFTSRADRRLRIGVVLVLGLVVGVPTALMIYVRTPWITDVGVAPIQPVEFDHRHHVRDDGIECLYCHDGADRSPHAGIPPAEVCMGCHNQVRRDDPALEPVRRSWFEHEPLVWQRVHDLPDFVFFDHSIHVARGIVCARCHGDVENMSWVRKVHRMTMGWCLECHDQRAPLGWSDPAPNAQLGPANCSTCHR